MPTTHEGIVISEGYVTNGNSQAPVVTAQAIAVSPWTATSYPATSTTAAVAQPVRQWHNR